MQHGEPLLETKEKHLGDAILGRQPVTRGCEAAEELADEYIRGHTRLTMFRNASSIRDQRDLDSIPQPGTLPDQTAFGGDGLGFDRSQSPQMTTIRPEIPVHSPRPFVEKASEQPLNDKIRFAA